MAEAGVDNLEERPSMEDYELSITIKYVHKREYTVYAGEPCDFETYMKWNYVLNNPTMLQTKQNNLQKQGVPWADIEQVDYGKGLVIDVGEVKCKIRDISITNLRDRVTKEILSDADALHVSSFPTGGVDKAEVSRQMMEKSANILRHQLWCFADDKGELIHYVCPRTNLGEVNGMFKTAIEERLSKKDYELSITIKYVYKREYTLDAGEPCDLETYMKWNYVLNNRTVFQTKQDNLQKQGVPWMKIEEVYSGYNGKGLVFDIGEVSSKIRDTVISNLRGRVVREILSHTDALHVSSFPTGGVDKAELSRQMMEKSANLLRHQLWCFADENGELIHYVCPRTMLKEVDRMIKSVIDDLIVVEKQVELLLVFFEVFKYYHVKGEADKIFGIKVDIDRLESKGKCIVTMTGPELQVQAVEKWLKENYTDNFALNEIHFKDIRGLVDTDIDVIIDLYLRGVAYENVFWYVDGKKGKICVCAPTADSCDKITFLLKRLKQQTLPDKFHQIICEMKEVKERRVILRRIRDTNEMEVIGLKTDLENIKSIISETTRKPEMSNYSDKRVNDGNNIANKSIKSRSVYGLSMTVGVKHDKLRGKEAHTSGQTNKVPERELVQAVPFPVRDPSIFRILCNFAKLKTFALEQGVVLEVTEGSSKGFLIRGGQSQCVSVKHRIDELISEYIAHGDRSPQTVQWTFSCGHQIILQSSMYLKDDVDHVVLVQESIEYEANYDKQFKLILPQWSEEKEKEVKTGIERCLDEFISHCQRKKLTTVKLQIPTLNRKVTQWFTVFLFEILSGRGAKWSPPFKLYVCTDDIELYHQTAELYDAIIKKVGGMDMTGQFIEGPSIDVENSSEALPSLDITQTPDNVGATARNTDTDSSDDESTGLEVCLIIDFQRKVNGKLQDFVRPFDLTLSPENFLKWQFICANQQELDQRLNKIRGDFENIVYDDGTLKISLGKQRRNPDLDELAQKIQTVFLEDTESLIINWFPTDMQIDTSVAASELDKVLQKLDMWKNKDIYMCTTNSGQIRFVFDTKHQKTVDALIQTTFKGCCVKLMPEYAHAKIDLPVVYGQVLHQMNIVTKVESKFPDISMTFDISHSSNQCTIELVGPGPTVEGAERWVNDNFANVYTTETLQFTDVDNWLEQLDISTLIKEQLLNKCPSDVFWMIHKPTQTVWTCSSDKRNLQDTVTEVRTCLKQRHIVMEKDEMSMDAVEKMLVWIGGMEDILNRRVAVNVSADDCGWNVCITGGRSYVESLADRIKQFVNEETRGPALVDTDDNGENAAGDIVHDA